MFIDLAVNLNGRFRVGQAKCTIISCSLIGMIQGAVISNVTPTVALASYAAAGVADSDLMKTSF